jgi:hypothetical protein
MKNINYQQIYEEEVSHTLRESLERPQRFYELSNQDRLLIEELVDIGYQRCIEDALDADILGDTAALSEDMSQQLGNFANMIRSYLGEQNSADGS